MPHASYDRERNLVGAFALALSDRVSTALAGRGGPVGNGAAALLLVHHGHVRRIDDLRSPLALTQAGVVRLVDRLAAAGLITRVTGADGDRRRVALKLTRAGATRARSLLRARERAISELLTDLPPWQLVQLASTADQVLAAIAAADPAPARICRYCDERACDLTRCPVELAEAGAAR